MEAKEVQPLNKQISTGYIELWERVGTEPEKVKEVKEKPQLAEQFVERVNIALDSLTFKERTVLKLKFGIEDGQKKTRRNIASIFQTDIKKVRSIEDRALRKLHRPSRFGNHLDRAVESSKELKEYLLNEEYQRN
jgi:DNA-directed RNA polymerase sigma subunit (sigma70/sigma32)